MLGIHYITFGVKSLEYAWDIQMFYNLGNCPGYAWDTLHNFQGKISGILGYSKFYNLEDFLECPMHIPEILH